ncbi:MAG: Stp1/IreP family PP2C-type Ser/Thr phosphatase, partial [Bacteroidota bacterium]
MENRNLKNFKFGNCTDIGKVRSQNEDYMGYFDNQNGDFFVVCDGMGGHAGGAVAAQKAVETIREFFQNQYYSQPEEAIYQALQYANQQIYLQAQENIALRGMGTTCVLMMLRDGLIYYGHVGDSRLYLRTEYGIKRLTKDHSFVQALIEQGLITEEEAENHPRKNELLRALGTQSFVDVSVSESPLKAVKHEQYLLCTDGLTSLVSDQGIDEVLNKNLTVQEKALRLVDLANTLGGYDNTTVQLIQFTDGGQEIIMESGKSTQIDSQGSSNNFNPPNQAYTGGSAQYIEPISESRYDDDYDRVQKSIVMSSQVSDGDYRPFLLRTFV